MRHFTDIRSYCFILKASFAHVLGVASLCTTMAKSQTPWHLMPVHLHVPPVCPLSSTFVYLTRPGDLYVMSFMSPKFDKTIVAPYKGYRFAPFVLPSLSCRTQVITGGTKHRGKKGLEVPHNTVFQGQCLQAISHNTNMVHTELQISFPQQQQHWWSQTAFLCLDLIKPVSHCQTFIWCTTKQPISRSVLIFQIKTTTSVLQYDPAKPLFHY